MNLSFYKPLLLPSNGIPYNKLIEIKEPDVSFLLRMAGSFLSINETELIYSILKKYTNIKDPGEMLFRDAYYVWIYLYSIVSQEESMTIHGICDYCRNEEEIRIPLEHFKTKHLKGSIYNEHQWKDCDWKIITSKRFLKQNIESGVEYEEIDVKEEWHLAKSFIKPQIASIFYKNEKVDIENKEEMLQEIGIKKIIELFSFLREENWGLPDFFMYQCSNCNNKNKSYLCDPLRSSIYSKSKETRQNKFLENVLSISSLKIISFNDLLGIPISYWEELVDNIDNINKQKYGKKDYFDVLREEMGE